MLRLVPLARWDPSSAAGDDHWVAVSGRTDIGLIHLQAGWNNRAGWHYSLYKIYEPGWNLQGSGATLGEATNGLAKTFRRWLKHAGLVEAETPGPLDGPPLECGRAHNLRTPVTCGQSVIGFLEKHDADSELPPWGWRITKLNDPNFPLAGSAETKEAALLGMSARWREWLTLAGLRGPEMKKAKPRIPGRARLGRQRPKKAA